MNGDDNDKNNQLQRLPCQGQRRWHDAERQGKGKRPNSRGRQIGGDTEGGGKGNGEGIGWENEDVPSRHWTVGTCWEKGVGCKLDIKHLRQDKTKEVQLSSVFGDQFSEVTMDSGGRNVMKTNGAMDSFAVG